MIAAASAAAMARWTAGPDQQRGVGGVVHVAALDQDFRHGGEVQASQVVAADVAVTAVVVADPYRRVAEHHGVDVAAEPHRRPDDLVVRAVGHRLQDGEAAAGARPAVGVNVDGHVGVGPVEYPGSRVDARPQAMIARPGHHHPRPHPDQVRAQVDRDVPGEPGLGVAAGGLGPGGVAALPLPAVPDLAIEERRAGVVQPVVAGIDSDDLAGQRQPAGRGPGPGPP